MVGNHDFDGRVGASVRGRRRGGGGGGCDVIASVFFSVLVFCSIFKLFCNVLFRGLAKRCNLHYT